MHQTRRRLAAFGAVSLLAPLLGGCAHRDGAFKPAVGQAGKDVIWVPTPDDVVQRMLDMARVTAGERVVDLGSGDGKIAIAAAKRGARARGIEYNEDMVALSRRNAQAQGVAVEFVQGDIFKADFSDADVVTLYLLPQLNERLRPILLNMKPGTRVTSHQFGMETWEPDRTDVLEGRQAHLWIVPAKVEGNWSVRVAGEPPFEMRIGQRHQRLDGHVVHGGQRLALQNPAIEGARIRFDVPRGDALLRFQGTADHQGRMEGTVTSGNAAPRPFTASRA